VVGLTRGALLGRHVGELALDHACLSLVRAVVRFRNAEVEQLHRARVGDHDVVRRYVPVNDVERLAMLVVRDMSVVKRPRHVDADANGDGDSHSPGLARLANHPPKRHSVDPLHHDEVRPFVRTELMKLADVRVLELHPDSRLVEEHLYEVVILLEVRQNPFHHHEAVVTVGVGVTREKNFGHATEREAPKDVIAGELSENRKVDWWPGYIAGCGFLRHFVLIPPKESVTAHSIAAPKSHRLLREAKTVNKLARCGVSHKMRSMRPSSRHMFFWCASIVPPPISRSFASLHNRSTAYSAT